MHHECAAATYTLAHEIGHLIGARHDLNLDKNMTPFPYGHGYVNGTKWRDIMSYKESCGGCPRLPVWSSPMVHGQGRGRRHARARQRPRDRGAGRRASPPSGDCATDRSTEAAVVARADRVSLPGVREVAREELG